MTWQPIETAPKDRWIIVTHNDMGGIGMVRYYQGCDDYHDGWYDSELGWMESTELEGYCGWIECPQHPLPARYFAGPPALVTPAGA